MENERVQQDHLTWTHDDIQRSVDLSLRGHSLGSQIVGIGSVSVRNEPKAMRSRHNPQTTVLNRRGR